MTSQNTTAPIAPITKTETEVLHVITLGDKRTQKDDIATCRTFVTELRKERQDTDEEANPAQ